MSSSTVKSSAIIHILDFSGKLSLWWWRDHTRPLSKKFEPKQREITMHFFFSMLNFIQKTLSSSFSLTSTVPQLLRIKARSVSGPNPITTSASKLRETLLINFYKWCNASFCFPDCQCGCYFLWKKGKKQEEQIYNSTELFSILKALLAILHPRVLHQPWDLGFCDKKTTSYPVFG